MDLIIGGANNTGCTSLSAPRSWQSSSFYVRPTAASCLLLCSEEGTKKVDKTLSMNPVKLIKIITLSSPAVEKIPICWIIRRNVLCRFPVSATRMKTPSIPYYRKFDVDSRKIIENGARNRLG